jgi:hypothetical protein
VEILYDGIFRWVGFIKKHTKTPLSKLLEEYPEPENGEAAAVAAV